jgi:uncharacterized protein
MNKRTAIIGASSNAERYSYKATVSLKKHGHTVFPIGIRDGEIEGEPILTGKPILFDIDTITLYLNAKNQVDWYDYILQIKPTRIIFNPGAENLELLNLATQHGIHCEVACTLVLLSIGNY